MPYIKTSDDLTFHYALPSFQASIDPQKPTMLLLHPRIFDLHVLDPQLNCERLSKGFNLLAVDHHWHGLTKVPMDSDLYDFKRVAKDLLAVMDALKIAQFHLFGVQVGAILGLRMATMAPNRILSLLLCSTPPPQESPQNVQTYRAMREVCRDSAGDGTDSIPQEIVNAGKWIYFGSHKDAELFPIWLKTSNLKASNQEYVEKFFSSLYAREPMSDAEWASITCPVLLMHGDDDRVYPLDDVHANNAKLVNVSFKQVKIVKGAPMFASWTHSAAVNTYLCDFLQELGVLKG
ncbi:hypothetical protein FRB91_006382 [Serendipita sp. 411]|nr:hypothetical protein FRB91_006382 [Serendipita sp. 411]